ncbi:bromodomain and WD repeat-containing protein 1-like [Spea bombifrons]|uniref:bromodomain and WD repeat-containing protein 1-like n=1 Tax=Spea bombifrons TaxID=233779 RepID=UPI002348FC45|nr:bromodomain and WD repeat-containing protein 1-like [Spea bombifrons]
MAEQPGPSRPPDTGQSLGAGRPLELPESELLFLIARYLSNGPCQKSAQVLIQEISDKKLLPKRADWLGNEHERTFDEMLTINHCLAPNHLLNMCQHLTSVLDKEIPSNLPKTSSFLGVGKQSALRTKDVHWNSQWNSRKLAALRGGKSFKMPLNIKCPPNVEEVHRSKHLTGALNFNAAVPVSMYNRLAMQKKILGHVSAVYCVAFDRTGRRIITGSDDYLLKIWSATDGRLIATLRGHSAEISEIAVNYENTLIASTSCENIIRVWSLRTCSPVAVLQGHSGSINALIFSPLVKGSVRYLVSAGGDATICLWQWDVNSLQFNPHPLKFIERSGPGAQILCCSCSSGGMFLAAGGSDHAIRVYYFGSKAPEKITELEQHSDFVDTIQFSNHGARFVSGSSDGTALIWKREKHGWNSIVLDMIESLGERCEEDRFMKQKVLTLAWTCSDSMIIAATSTHFLKVWDSLNGNLLHVLTGHQNDVYVLEPHPNDERILLSAGHDGNVFLWDIEKGVTVKRYFNEIQDEDDGFGAILDCKFSPDGQYLAAGDSHGRVLFFAFGCNSPYAKVPDQMFFHTDYRPLCQDDRNFVLDEQTQLAPHLMPPPFLVDLDGNPYSPSLQRLVPGRENCVEEHLVPLMGYVETRSGEIAEQVVDQLIHNENNQTELQQRGSRSSPVPERFAWKNRVVTPALPSAEYKKQEQYRTAKGEDEKVDFEKHLPPDKNDCNGYNKRVYAKPMACNDSQMDINVYSSDDVSSEDEASVLLETSHASFCFLLYALTCKISITTDWAWLVKNEGKHLLSLLIIRTLGFSCAAIELILVSGLCRAAGSTRPPLSLLYEPSNISSPSVAEEEEEEEEDEHTNETNARSDSSSEDEIPIIYHPPLWITDTMPHRSPFVPQIGDEVVYFRQGYEAYLSAADSLNIPISDSAFLQPWKEMPLREQELVKIIEVHYIVGPPTLCHLKLALMDPATGSLTDNAFFIRYHDMPGVIDFLVLRQFYERACKRSWQSSDRFRSVIDDVWWFGTVLSQDAYHEDYPDSPFQSYTVKWDNSEIETLSPWDMDVIPDDVVQPQIRGTSISVTTEEMSNLLYCPQEAEWGHGGQDGECDRVVCGIDQLLSLEIAKYFAAPVDLNIYPTYCKVVAYPTDLGTIRMRLLNRFYRRAAALIWEVRHIELNARTFNEPDSYIAMSAKEVTDLLIHFILDSNRIDIKDMRKTTETDEPNLIDDCCSNQQWNSCDEESDFSPASSSLRRASSRQILFSSEDSSSSSSEESPRGASPDNVATASSKCSQEESGQWPSDSDAKTDSSTSDSANFSLSSSSASTSSGNSDKGSKTKKNRRTSNKTASQAKTKTQKKSWKKSSGCSDASVSPGKVCKQTKGSPKKTLRKSAALAANKIKCMSDGDGASSSDGKESNTFRTVPLRTAAAVAMKRLCDLEQEESTKSDSESDVGTLEDVGEPPSEMSESTASKRENTPLVISDEDSSQSPTYTEPRQSRGNNIYSESESDSEPVVNSKRQRKALQQLSDSTSDSESDWSASSKSSESAEKASETDESQSRSDSESDDNSDSKTNGKLRTKLKKLKMVIWYDDDDDDTTDRGQDKKRTQSSENQEDKIRILLPRTASTKAKKRLVDDAQTEDDSSSSDSDTCVPSMKKTRSECPRSPSPAGTGRGLAESDSSLSDWNPRNNLKRKLSAPSRDPKRKRCIDD